MTSTSAASCTVAKAATLDALSSMLIPRSQQSRSAGRVSNSSAKQCDKEQKRLATLEKYSSRYTYSSSSRSTGASASSCNAVPSHALNDSSSSLGISNAIFTAMSTPDNKADAKADSFMDTSEGTGESTSGRRVAERGDLVALAEGRSRSKLPSNHGDANKAVASSFKCCAVADGSQQCRCAAPPPPLEFDVYRHLMDISRAV